MRVSRVLIVTLALMVSPVAAAVCEVVCGTAPHASHQVDATAAPAPAGAIDEHAHHGHHPAPAPETVVVRTVSSGDVSVSIPAPDCDLRGAVPARLRAASSDLNTSSAATATSAYRLDCSTTSRVLIAGAASSPPGPPPLTSLPLRI